MQNKSILSPKVNVENAAADKNKASDTTGKETLDKKEKRVGFQEYKHVQQVKLNTTVSSINKDNQGP